MVSRYLGIVFIVLMVPSIVAMNQPPGNSTGGFMGANGGSQMTPFQLCQAHVARQLRLEPSKNTIQNLTKDSTDEKKYHHERSKPLDSNALALPTQDNQDTPKSPNAFCKIMLSAVLDTSAPPVQDDTGMQSTSFYDPKKQ